MAKHQFRDMTRHEIWKLLHQDRSYAKLNIHRVPNKISINSAFSRFSIVANVRVRSHHQIGSCECTFVAPGSISTHHGSGLSRSSAFITCYIHKEWNFQGLAQPARNFSLFFVRRYGRVNDDWHSLAVFFQGPIGLDGPKGDPVSSPHNLHFNFRRGVTSVRN